MGRWSLVIVIAAAAGCGDNLAGPALDGATSGTRLKLRYYDFGSIRQLAGVRDTRLDADCEPFEWADGNTYCVPASPGYTAYANASCTQRIGVAYADPDCPRPPPAYFIEYESRACNYRPAHLYPRGAKLAVTQVWIKNDDGSCSGPSSNETSAYYALGTEVAVTDFAAITTSTSMAGRLGQRVYESADGLRYPVLGRVRDAVLGGDCYLGYSGPGSGTGRCVPANTASAYQFIDAACTQPQVTVDSACPAPKVTAKYGACPDDPTQYYTLASQLTPTTVYFTSGMTCTAAPASPSERYYAIGAEFTVATTSRTRGTGTGRLQPIHFTTPEGLLHRDYPMFDAQLGVECTVLTLADGSVVCVPDSNSAEIFYTDAGCTTAVDLMQVYKRNDTCSPPPVPSYALRYTESEASCGAYTYEVRRVGTQFTGAALYVKNEGTCVAFTATNYVPYRLTDVVPLGDLPAGTLVTDP